MPFQAPAFWYDRNSMAARLLAPVGHVYGAFTRQRMQRPGLIMNVPVICVGNPTLGGTGKTPFAALLVDHLRSAGGIPAIVTRGYGGALSGPVVVDPMRHSARDVGDEALLHAAKGLTIKATARVRGAALAVLHGASHIILDDGFQNPALIFQRAFLLVDAATGLGNGRIFPAGPLRADFASQAKRADALVLVGRGRGEVSNPAIERAFGLDRPIIRVRLVPEPECAAALKGQPVIGYCGLGLPEKFRQTLEDCGAEIMAYSAFADHHVYGDADARKLLDLAGKYQARLVTTAKDHVKLLGTPLLKELADLSTVCPVSMQIEDGQVLLANLLAGL